MSDFYQDGVITNFHNLTNRKVEELEYDLQVFSGRRSMGLILPSLFSELEGPALTKIVDELTKVPYLEEIVIGLDRADRDQFLFAREFFSRLPQRHRILWNDGPRLTALDQELQKEGLSPMEPGKGRNVWFCVGYTLASRRTSVVGLHDCDIVTYSRDMLARLMYPVANPNFHYDFCKGYYARVADGKFNGRVGRLLVFPLLKSLQIVFLSELHRNTATRRICQVDIADNYDHKHQPMSEDDATNGLQRMSIDITKALYRKMAILGVNITSESFRILKATYYRNALDMIDAFENDAKMNGLSFDRHSEESAVELFSGAIMEAGQAFVDTPSEKPFIPSWSRVQSAFPDMLERLHDAVEQDNEGDV